VAEVRAGSGEASSRRRGTTVLVAWVVALRAAGVRAGLGAREVARTVVLGRARRRVVIARPMPGGG
jgi:hypothetical protein